MSEIRNALIEDTMLGIEDHGIATFFLYLDYGDSSHQGYGGYGLDEYSEKDKKRHGHAYGMEAIIRVLETVGVCKWEDLRGKYIRVRGGGLMSKIEAIGHITKNRWLDLKELASTYSGKEVA